MSKYECPKCKHAFSDNAHLLRHLARKTPCEPIREPAEAGQNLCKYCGRDYQSPQALSRHIKHRCRIATSSTGMNMLIDHAIQKQNQDLEAKLETLTQIVAKQTEMMALLVQARSGEGDDRPATIINGPAIVNNNCTQIILPWDGESRIKVDVSHVRAAFNDNTRLKEYSKLPAAQMTSNETAPPYVAEFFTDITRRAHANPETRNIYLNPQRADQVLIYLKSGVWEVRTLDEAIRLICDGIAECIRHISLRYEERIQLPQEAQQALSIVGLLYGEDPNEYARRVKTPLAAHLQNTAPGALVAKK
jgi:hypothetical protein